MHFNTTNSRNPTNSINPYYVLSKNEYLRFINGVKSYISKFYIFAGGAERVRTADLKLAKLALSQLSYCPAYACIFRDWRSPLRAYGS